MTSDERFALIQVKLERAKKHVRDLEGEIRTFLDSNPYVIETKPEAHNPKAVVYFVAKVRETPAIIPAIVGDVLYNLRAALDHLAFHLVQANGGTPTKQTYFPISDDAAKYKTEAPGKVKGMSQVAIDAINATKPYKGGNDALWRLHRLNNIDKHRTLVTVGVALQHHSVPLALQRPIVDAVRAQQGAPKEWLDVIDQTPKGADLGITVIPPNRKCLLKAGDELPLAWTPALELDEQVNFTFEIAFNEPQVAEGDSFLQTLQQTSDLVDNIVLAFKPLL